jgi:hypothetical protein
MEEKEAFLEKFQAQRENWEDLEDVVKFNQIKKMIKSEFIKLESKSDWIQIWILHISRYFGHNFQFKYWIEFNRMELESRLNKL